MHICLIHLNVALISLHILMKFLLLVTRMLHVDLRKEYEVGVIIFRSLIAEKNAGSLIFNP